MSIERELKTEVVRERARALKIFDDCHPDVGMPPQWWVHVDDALKQLGYSKDDVNYDDLVRK